MEAERHTQATNAEGGGVGEAQGSGGAGAIEATTTTARRHGAPPPPDTPTAHDSFPWRRCGMGAALVMAVRSNLLVASIAAWMGSMGPLWT